MDMEIEVLYQYVSTSDPKPLMDDILNMVSGEASFSPATLSLAYGRLIRGAFPKHSPNSDAGQNVTIATTAAATSARPRKRFLE